MFRVIKDIAYKHDDEYYYRIVRKNIRRLREEKRITQWDLAEMIDRSREYVADIESDKRGKHVTIATLGRIAEALGVEIGELFRK